MSSTAKCLRLPSRSPGVRSTAKSTHPIHKASLCRRDPRTTGSSCLPLAICPTRCLAHRDRQSGPAHWFHWSFTWSMRLKTTTPLTQRFEFVLPTKKDHRTTKSRTSRFARRRKRRSLESCQSSSPQRDERVSAWRASDTSQWAWRRAGRSHDDARSARCWRSARSRCCLTPM